MEKNYFIHFIYNNESNFQPRNYLKNLMKRIILYGRKEQQKRAQNSIVKANREQILPIIH